MPVTRVVATLVLGVALAAVACADGSAPSVPAGPSSVTPTAPSRSTPATVPEILDFQAPLVGGGTFRGAELAGSPVAIWFWAPW